MPAAGDPISAADVTAIEDLTVEGPCVRLVQTVAQSIADNTATALTFSTEELDTNGFHDTGSNTQRITPNIAGWYRFFGNYCTNTLPGTLVFQACYLRKNGGGGTSIAPVGKGGLPSTVSQSQQATALISMNGSTDYVEVMAIQDSTGSANTAVSAFLSSVFECQFVRNL
jgi:hypothetical protein